MNELPEIGRQQEEPASVLPASKGDAQAPEDRTICSRRRRHREMLLVVTGVVLLAFVLEVRPDQRVSLRCLPEYALPETCLTRPTFETPCPGCGLTRSFIYLARGEWHRALSLHRLGWLLAVVVLLQFPYRLFCLLRSDGFPAMRVVSLWFGYILLALLVCNWLYDRIFLY